MRMIHRIKEAMGRGIGNERSAENVVPVLMRMLSPKRVLDVGCGGGSWAREFVKHGCRVVGIDRWKCGFSDDRFIFKQEDLSHRTEFPKADVVICLEVAEHLPEKEADALVCDLTRAADIVVFAAGIPLQGGLGHINEQWQSWWCAKFKKRGYVASDCVRPLIWDNEWVSPWYRQDMIVFTKPEEAARLHLPVSDHLLDVVHPDSWTSIGAMGVCSRIEHALGMPASAVFIIGLVAAATSALCFLIALVEHQ